MPGKGNRRLVIRLPSDHWVWSYADTHARNAEVAKALDIYPQLGRRLEAIEHKLEEIKEELRLGELVLTHGPAQDGSADAATDRRLLANIHKFLEW